LKPDHKKAHEYYAQLLKTLGRLPESEEQKKLAGAP
jgi:hypothetical protein